MSRLANADFRRLRNNQIDREPKVDNAFRLIRTKLKKNNNA